MLYLFASNLFFFMKKHLFLLAAFVLSTASFGQLKVLKFGAKAGLNYPQTSLSASDVLAIYNDQTYDISNLQTDISNGFNAGLIARVALPLIPAYVHSEALYTRFDQNISMTDDGTEVDLSSTIQRLDFPISAGAKFGPAFVGLGATPSIPLANTSDIWNEETEANFTWGWHIHAGLKLWKLLAEVKYESGFGILAREVDYNYNDTDYNFSLDARSSQVVLSVGYFFD
jgi:hypothetical protein